MEENNKKNGLGCCIAILILVVIIFVPMIVIPIKQQIDRANETKHIENLVEQGKVKSDNEVINEIVEILKKRDEDRLEQYFAEGFIYYDNNNNVEYKYLDNFWIDLTTYISSYEIEKKDDANEENLEAYEVYWNIVEANKNIGIDKTDKNYCLQRIRIILKKVVMKDFITYKLNRIVLTNK